MDCKHTDIDLKHVLLRDDIKYLQCNKCGMVFPIPKSQNLELIESTLKSIITTLHAVDLNINKLLQSNSQNH